ncbi:transient receptor potential cation channel subfamily A member 1 homolog isoform X2 [Macrobrachium nipponense]|uniref:transient receptor potential cation channel subfamily A member 1 homolog isoform X2 n=1 Tax=Macrobrachium nipponense TaxID=159736 RepID=UPI0030C84399
MLLRSESDINNRMYAKRYSVIPINEGIREAAGSPGCDLVDAVTRKDVAFCRGIITTKNVNLKLDQDETLLHVLAMKYGKRKKSASDILLLLLEMGAKCNARNKDGNTPLHIAAREGHDEFCKILIDQKNKDKTSLLDMKSSCKMTPLHLAAQQGQVKVVSLLLTEGADATLRDNNQYLPLHYAAAAGYHEICELLRDTYPTADLTGCNPPPPLMLAAKGGYEWCCRKLVLSKKDLNWQDKQRNTPMHIVAKKGFEYFLAYLIKQGADLDVQNKAGNTPLMEAISKNALGCLNLLIDSGANLSLQNEDEKGVLHLAAEKKADDCLNLLLHKNSVKKDIDKKDKTGCTPLLTAIRKGSDKCSFMLLQAGASPQEKCNLKFTALHYAAQTTTTDVLQELLRNKAIDVNAANYKGLTPLHMAAEKGAREACMKLLRRGARVEATDKQSRTALHISTLHGHSAIIKLLDKHGAQKKALNENKSTALHIAADTGNLECCKVLTKADPHLCKITDSKGRYPIDIAFQKGHNKVSEFFLQSLHRLPPGLEKNLHRHTHQALKERNRSAIEMIIESCWWEKGFVSSADNLHERGPCDNFRQTIKLYPDLAKILMDKCVITSPCGYNFNEYNFRLLEDCYYMATATAPHKTTMQENKYDPFAKTGALKPEAREFTSDSVQWKNSHPVHLMTKWKCLGLLKHSVTERWLLCKWNKYIRNTYIFILLLQIVLSLFIIAFLSFVPNWRAVSTHISNMSQDVSCEDFQRIQDPYIKKVREGYSSFVACHILLFLAALSVFCLEVFSLSKMRHTYFRDLTHLLRLACTVLAFVLVFPYESCETLIKPAIPWESGVLSFMLSSICLMNTINKLPSCSYFSNITHQFIRSYLKGLFLISVIILTFAYCFHLLMRNDEAFQSIFHVIIKMVVWVLGDLAFDDTFGTKELTYPIITMFLYLGFICMVGAFIVSLVKAPSVDPRTAAFNEAASFANFVLTIDVCLPQLRKKYAVSKYSDKDRKSWVKKLEDWWMNLRPSAFRRMVIPLTTNVTMMELPAQRRPWLTRKIEQTANFFGTLTSGDDADDKCFTISNEQQEKIDPQSAKLDQLLTMCKKLVHDNQVQNEQINELKQLHNEQVTELKQQINTLMTSLSVKT